MLVDQMVEKHWDAIKQRIKTRYGMVSDEDLERSKPGGRSQGHWQSTPGVHGSPIVMDELNLTGKARHEGDFSWIREAIDKT